MKEDRLTCRTLLASIGLLCSLGVYAAVDVQDTSAREVRR